MTHGHGDPVEAENGSGFPPSRLLPFLLCPPSARPGTHVSHHRCSSRYAGRTGRGQARGTGRRGRSRRASGPLVLGFGSTLASLSAQCLGGDRTEFPAGHPSSTHMCRRDVGAERVEGSSPCVPWPSRVWASLSWSSLRLRIRMWKDPPDRGAREVTELAANLCNCPPLLLQSG